MAATAHLSSDPPTQTRDSVEDLQQIVRDLEVKESELRRIQASPDLYRAEETSNIALRKRAIEDEIAQLEAHPPRLFKGKHKMRIEDLRIDLRYLDTQLVKIENDRAHYVSWVPTELQRTANELEIARQRLAMREPARREPVNREPEPREPENRESERHEPASREPEYREPVTYEAESHAVEEPERLVDDTFYRETMAPAILALMEARMDDDRLRFLDGYKQATTLLGRRQLQGVDDEAQQKSRILYDYVLGYPCMEWFPGDPAQLLTDLRDRARAWNSTADSDDAPFELALAYGLMIVPRQVMAKLEQSPKAGDVRHRMKQIEEACPGAMEASERKCIHVMRIADAEWLRKQAEWGLDRLNQLRR